VRSAKLIDYFCHSTSPNIIVVSDIKIPFNVPFLTGKEHLWVSQVIAARRFSGDGHFTRKAEQQLQNATGAIRAILTPSCTSALELATLVLDIQAGDEIIMPSFTFVSTANPFVLRGAKIVFADVDPVTMNMDANQLPSLITKKTKAIVPVHYAGVACDMNAIMELAEAHSIVVIEDAAQCLGSTYNGKALGTIGHFGCLSFHDTKNIQCGEGGALLINDENLIERAASIRDKGTNRPAFLRGDVDQYSWVDVGSSFLTNELTAAFLLPQFAVIDAVAKQRKKLCNLYAKNLKKLADLELISFDKTPTAANGHLFFVKVNAGKRGKIIEGLAAQGIDARFHYIPLHSSIAGQRFGTMPVDNFTTKESEKLMRLPMFYDLQREQVVHTCEVLTNVIKS
jgi:dTDP-4-amino-4,6-dideoxygalactose transaminase